MRSTFIIGALLAAASGYLGYQVSSERAQMARQAAVQENVKKKMAVAGPDAAKQQNAAAAEIEGAGSAQESSAAAQRARWPSYKFPPPNGGLLVYTIMPDGNPACASYDGGVCLWGMSRDGIDFKRVKPLVCGEEHRAKFGVSGYENLKHWCNLAKRVHADQR